MAKSIPEGYRTVTPSFTFKDSKKAILLNSLDRDVEIIIKPKAKKEKIATTHVILTAVA